MSQQATKSSEGKKGRGPIVMEGITSVAFKKDIFLLSILDKVSMQYIMVQMSSYLCKSLEDKKLFCQTFKQY